MNTLSPEFISHMYVWRREFRFLYLWSKLLPRTGQLRLEIIDEYILATYYMPSILGDIKKTQIEYGTVFDLKF